MGKKRIIEPSQEELLKEGEKMESSVKKGVAIEAPRKIKTGRICIFSSYNNTIIVITDLQGAVLGWMSAGSIGFKGTKKGTPFAASKVAEGIAESAKKLGISSVEVFLKGIGSGRESALRSLATHGLDIISIKDVTPVPHNGCKPPKPRRV